MRYNVLATPGLVINDTLRKSAFVAYSIRFFEHLLWSIHRKNTIMKL